MYLQFFHRRSKPQRRTLFSEEYLGNLDDYDFTDFAINDNAVKRKSRFVSGNNKFNVSANLHEYLIM